MFFKYSKLDITRTANKTYQTYPTFAENLEDMIDSQFVNDQNFSLTQALIILEIKEFLINFN